MKGEKEKARAKCASDFIYGLLYEAYERLNRGYFEMACLKLEEEMAFDT